MEALKNCIVIEGQFDGEIDWLMHALDDGKPCTVGGASCVVGTVSGHPVVAADIGMGEVSAAVHTTMLLEAFHPYCVIDQGTSGGHTDQLFVGDIVLGRETVNTGALQTAYRGPGEGSRPEDWHFFTPGTILEETAGLQSLKGDEHLLSIALETADCYPHGKVVEGVYASADVWNREVDRIRWVREHCGTDVEEMESYASAFACQMHNVPWLGIRVISNSDITGEAYNGETGIWCQQFTLEVVKQIIATGHLSF